MNGRHETHTGFREGHATRQLVNNEEIRVAKL